MIKEAIIWDGSEEIAVEIETYFGENNVKIFFDDNANPYLVIRTTFGFETIRKKDCPMFLIKVNTNSIYPMNLQDYENYLAKEPND